MIGCGLAFPAATLEGNVAPDQKEQPRWIRYLAYAFATVWLGTFLYRYIDPTSRQDRAILRNFSSQQILSISVEPARAGYPTLVNQTVLIKDRQSIAAFSKAFSHLSGHNPEHPEVTRAAILRIQLKDRVLGGYLEESSNDGTVFYCMSGVTKGWVYGTYLVPDGGELFNLINEVRAHASSIAAFAESFSSTSVARCSCLGPSGDCRRSCDLWCGVPVVIASRWR